MPSHPKTNSEIQKYYHWIVLYVLNNHITYFDSTGVEHAPKWL